VPRRDVALTKGATLMRIPATFTDSDLMDAYAAADVVASEAFRPYLPGRLLPLLVARFRDDVAEALGMELPPLRSRPSARVAKPDELASSELAALWGAVEALARRFAPCMDDPELPRLLTSLLEDLMAEKAERARISGDHALKVRAS
jgi:hypothetical protein